MNAVFRMDLVHFSIESVGEMRSVMYPTETVVESAVWRVSVIVEWFCLFVCVWRCVSVLYGMEVGVLFCVCLCVFVCVG